MSYKTHGIFPDEQNGFRAGRSCEDHIFTLSSIIKNRNSENKSTFCAFVDMEKAFDWVNRDLLLYRLLEHKITGRMYHAVQSLLSNTQSCVQLDKDTHTELFTCDCKDPESQSPTLGILMVLDWILGK